MLTQERLHQCLDYDPDTGVFKWKTKGRGSRYRKVGQLAGTRILGDGGGKQLYWGIGIDGERYRAHSLAWFYVYGVWPELLDHIDRNGLNNAISNLREATPKQNQANTVAKKHNKLGVKGVHRKKNINHANPFVARIVIDGKEIHLGCFATVEAASEARRKAEQEHYGEYSGLR